MNISFTHETHCHAERRHLASSYLFTTWNIDIIIRECYLLCYMRKHDKLAVQNSARSLNVNADKVPSKRKLLLKPFTRKYKNEMKFFKIKCSYEVLVSAKTRQISTITSSSALRGLSTASRRRMKQSDQNNEFVSVGKGTGTLLWYLLNELVSGEQTALVQHSAARKSNLASRVRSKSTGPSITRH